MCEVVAALVRVARIKAYSVKTKRYRDANFVVTEPVAR